MLEKIKEICAEQSILIISAHTDKLLEDILKDSNVEYTMNTIDLRKTEIKNCSDIQRV